MPTFLIPSRICFTPIFDGVILLPDMLKPNKIKLILALCIVSAGIWLTSVIILKTNRSKGPVEILRQLPKNIDISLQKIHYTDVKDGEKRWTLVADKVEYDRERNYTYFRNVKMELFSHGGGENKITLTADNAAYHNKTEDVEVEGNVTATNNTGMRFETARLFYQSSRSLISTNDHVRFTDGKLTVEGTGMELLIKAKKVRILNNVTALIGARAK
jgi:LPS export ABC transporter protein LptC